MRVRHKPEAFRSVGTGGCLKLQSSLFGLSDFVVVDDRHVHSQTQPATQWAEGKNSGSDGAVDLCWGAPRATAYSFSDQPKRGTLQKWCGLLQSSLWGREGGGVPSSRNFCPSPPVPGRPARPVPEAEDGDHISPFPRRWL